MLVEGGYNVAASQGMRGDGTQKVAAALEAGGFDASLGNRRTGRLPTAPGFRGARRADRLRLCATAFGPLPITCWADRSGMSVQLRPVHLRWIKGSKDDPADLCAHGDFEFRIDGDVLSDGSAGRELTLSAAALYLLRTVSRSHTKDEPVGDHLFPCCGHAMYDVPEQDDVVIVGCPNGEDFEVVHREEDASVLVRVADGRDWSVDRDSWRDAVFTFADAVAEFYARSSPKRPTADDSTGFRAFQAEWERRRGRPFGRISSKQGPSPDGPTTRSS